MNIYRVLSGSTTRVLRKSTIGIGGGFPHAKSLINNPNRIWLSIVGADGVEFQVALTDVATNHASVGSHNCLSRGYPRSFFKE